MTSEKGAAVKWLICKKHNMMHVDECPMCREIGNLKGRIAELSGSKLPSSPPAAETEKKEPTHRIEREGGTLYLVCDAEKHVRELEKENKRLRIILSKQSIHYCSVCMHPQFLWKNGDSELLMRKEVLDIIRRHNSGGEIPEYGNAISDSSVMLYPRKGTPKPEKKIRSG